MYALVKGGTISLPYEAIKEVASKIATKFETKSRDLHGSLVEIFGHKTELYLEANSLDIVFNGTFENGEQFEKLLEIVKPFCNSKLTYFVYDGLTEKSFNGSKND